MLVEWRKFSSRYLLFEKIWHSRWNGSIDGQKRHDLNLDETPKWFNFIYLSFSKQCCRKKNQSSMIQFLYAVSNIKTGKYISKICYSFILSNLNYISTKHLDFHLRTLVTFMKLTGFFVSKFTKTKRKTNRSILENMIKTYKLIP